MSAANHHIPKSLITTAIQAVLLGTMFSGAVLAAKNAAMNHTTRYLDPSIWNITVSDKDCFLAAPRSLLQVEPVTSDKGYRVYKVSQFFDPEQEKVLYAKSINEQIKDHKIVGREFCGGIVSMSNMDLPFSKKNSIADVNDGILLADKVRRDLSNIQAHVNATTGAGGLNISHLSIQTLTDAYNALAPIAQAKDQITREKQSVDRVRPKLEASADHDATITTVDLNGPQFVVQQTNEIS